MGGGGTSIAGQKASVEGRRAAIERKNKGDFKGVRETGWKIVQTKGEGEKRREFTAPLASQKDGYVNKRQDLMQKNAAREKSWQENDQCEQKIDKKEHMIKEIKQKNGRE